MACRVQVGSGPAGFWQTGFVRHFWGPRGWSKQVPRLCQKPLVLAHSLSFGAVQFCTICGGEGRISTPPASQVHKAVQKYKVCKFAGQWQLRTRVPCNLSTQGIARGDRHLQRSWRHRISGLGGRHERGVYQIRGRATGFQQRAGSCWGSIDLLMFILLSGAEHVGDLKRGGMPNFLSNSTCIRNEAPPRQVATFIQNRRCFCNARWMPWPCQGVHWRSESRMHQRLRMIQSLSAERQMSSS
jgi:hypothetical protein